MYAHTVALSVGLDAQRQAIERSQRALATGIEVQTNLAESTVDAVSRQEDIQRRLLSLQHVVAHRLFDRVDEQGITVDGPSEQLRTVTDDQFSSLYDGHRELFEMLTADLEQGTTAFETISTEYLAAVDELAALAVAATEQTETQLSGDLSTC